MPEHVLYCICIDWLEPLLSDLGSSALNAGRGTNDQKRPRWCPLVSNEVLPSTVQRQHACMR